MLGHLEQWRAKASRRHTVEVGDKIERLPSTWLEPLSFGSMNARQCAVWLIADFVQFRLTHALNQTLAEMSCSPSLIMPFLQVVVECIRHAQVWLKQVELSHLGTPKPPPELLPPAPFASHIPGAKHQQAAAVQTAGPARRKQHNSEKRVPVRAGGTTPSIPLAP